MSVCLASPATTMPQGDPMTETITTQPARRKSLPGRAVGVIFSPRATYADVAAFPRPFAALAIVLAVTVVPTMALLSTEVGQEAMLDQQIRTVESFGIEVTDQMYEGMQQGMQYATYVAAANQIVVLPVLALAVAGLLLAVFGAFLGGNASFRQVFAVVVHSGLVLALAAPFTAPLNYARQSMSSATNISVFAPFLDETSFAARLLGSIDLFYIWWLVNLAIGIGVLYKRPTAPIATGLLVAYATLALIIAGVVTTLSGA
jgi:hypothetical protein